VMVRPSPSLSRCTLRKQGVSRYYHRLTTAKWGGSARLTASSGQTTYLRQSLFETRMNLPTDVAEVASSLLAGLCLFSCLTKARAMPGELADLEDRAVGSLEIACSVRSASKKEDVLLTRYRLILAKCEELTNGCFCGMCRKSIT